MKSKYGTYAEYHTSLDDLFFVTSKGLSESIRLYRKIITLAEKNVIPSSNFLCEAQLGKRDLISTLSKTGSSDVSRNLLDILAYSDGDLDLIDIADKTKLDLSEIIDATKVLEEKELISTSKPNFLTRKL